MPTTTSSSVNIQMIMGFASIDYGPDGPSVNLDIDRRLFATVQEALDSVANEITEYGISVHKECQEDWNAAVDHPKHYNAHPSGVECITVVESMGFNLGNAIKYIWRADEKRNVIEDLKKAAWYVNREIERRQNHG